MVEEEMPMVQVEMVALEAVQEMDLLVVILEEQVIRLLQVHHKETMVEAKVLIVETMQLVLEVELELLVDPVHLIILVMVVMV